MPEMSAVIGANYGDEGKGLVTDYLSGGGTLVVRFNGGAQAGHTVVAPDGCRHVFHHFGAGTLRGAATFLSRYFILNPILFGRERRELEGKGVRPRVMLDGCSPITTPYDMMLNRAAERARGSGRHGSCGLGIDETLQRHARRVFRLCLNDVLPSGGGWTRRCEEALREALRRIRSDYVPRREATLGICGAVERQCDSEEAIIGHYISDVAEMVGGCDVGCFEETLAVRRWSGVIFEGAQGLRLDMESPDFPHVTHSKTGLANVMALMRSAALREPL